MPNIVLNPIPTAIRVTLNADTEVGYRDGNNYEFSQTETSSTTFDFTQIQFLSDYLNIRGTQSDGRVVTFEPGADITITVYTTAGTTTLAY